MANTKLDRIEHKVDTLLNKVSDISNEVVRNSTVLEEHQRRSKANEDAVDLLRTELDPIKKHVAMWGGAAKVAVAIGSVIAALGAIAGIAVAMM